MILKNNFKEEDKIRVWADHPYCAFPNCNSNDKCSIHHIDGRISSSIYNGIMLCYKHHKYCDGHNISDEKLKTILTRIALRMVTISNYIADDNDKTYLLIIKNRLEKILNMV